MPCGDAGVDEYISPLRLRELLQHEQDNAALRAREAALLAALDALVQDMATISGVHGVPHADASEPAMKATAYWQGRLDGLLRQHREGR